MAWLSRSLGDSVSSLTGQLSSLTKDILTEGTEEVSDHATELTLAKERIQQLEALYATQKAENDRLKRVNRELEEKAESSELQINSISREYRTLLEEKEKEVNTLKQRHHELLEQHAKSALHSPAEATPSNLLSHSTDQSQGFDGEGLDDWTTEGWGDFDDSLRLQREINHLRQEVTRLRADSQHWRSVAGQLGAGRGDEDSAQHELLTLRTKIKELEKNVAASREQAQHEVVSLQDVHQTKMAALKKRHKEEMTQLESRLSALEQQLADVRDTDSTSTAHSASVLPESDRMEEDGSAGEIQSHLAELQQQLVLMTREKDKVQAAKSHLEGELQELQTEVETLQIQREEQLVRIAELDTALRKQSQQHADEITLLRRQMEDLEEECSRVSASEQQESKLKSSIVEAGTELQQVSSETESLVDHLDNPEEQGKASEVMDNLERENLVLKEQAVKLREQVTLLEKRVVGQQEDWQSSQETIGSLRRQLKQLRGEAGSDTDNTLDHSFTSDNLDSTSYASPPPPSTLSHKDDESTDWQIEREALEDVLTQLRQELREKDEQLSQLSAVQDRSTLEQELASLRQERESLQEELSTLQEREASLQEEKEELETSIGELDEQHQEATDHLIAARNLLQAQLMQSQQQVKDLQAELEKLTQQQSGSNQSSSLPDTSPSSSAAAELTDNLKDELKRMQEELASARKLAESKDTEIVDLKTKLQKGSLAVNDLHMDKKELEEELGRQQEEVKAKVAVIKTTREEKARLAEENRELVERLQEMEEELEAWQQRNEDAQVYKAETEKLHTELAHLQTDYASAQDVLNSQRAECEELWTSNSQLQEERDRLKAELVHVVEKAISVQQMASLEKEMADLSIQTGEAGRVTELQVGALREQIDSLTRENAELRLSSQQQSDVSETQAGASEGILTELLTHNQQLALLFQRRSDTLEKIGTHYEAEKHRQGMQDVLVKSAKDDPHLKRDRVLVRVMGPSISELKADTEHLLGYLHEEKDVLQRLQTGSEDSEQVQLPLLHGSSQVTLAENDRLLQVIRDKDSLLSDLQENLQSTHTEKVKLSETLELTSKRQQALDSAISEKESEIENLHAQNVNLTRTCEEHIIKRTDAESHIISLKEQLLQAESDLRQVKADSEAAERGFVAESEEAKVKTSSLITQLQTELAAAQDQITQLEAELEEKNETLSCHQAGIESLNAKCMEQQAELDNIQSKSSQQENIIAMLQQNSFTGEQELEAVKLQLLRAKTFLTPDQHAAVEEGETLPLIAPTSNLPALEFPNKPSLEQVKTENSSLLTESDQNQDHRTENGSLEKPQDSTGESRISDSSKSSKLSQKIEELQKQVEEKEGIIHDLQHNNTSLVQMLEARSLAQPGDANLLEVHKLESEVKALKVEKEQMLAVMNEKSREASSLKAEVMRLMSVVSAEKSALEKLQKDNQELMARPSKDDSMDDMQREALQNLSRLVRDREMEIEALKQKNETLMVVLQDMNQDGAAKGGTVVSGAAAATLSSHFADKENLEKQLAALQSEREQMVAFVNQKHSESVTYHAEIQRLNALRSEEGERIETLQAEYDKLCSQFEDRNQSLLKAQNDLINYKQRFAEVEVKYGELLQKSNASDTVDAVSFRAVEEEKELLASRQSELQHSLHDRDEKIRTVSEKLRELENTSQARESENASLRKQVEHLGFQLKDLNSETEDLRKDKESAEQRMQHFESNSHVVKDLNNQLTLSLREKEFEVTSLQERLQKVTALMSEQQGEKTQVAQLLRDQEATAGERARLQQEVDQLTLRLRQKQQELNDMQAENLRLKDKEHKLNRELERLRGHLLQIEEGYTREALEAEEREKSLRNRLADAEEKVLSSASQVQSASQQASQQVESLQQQLHTLAAQRDSAYMQVAGLQEQSQQYASSLSNLQLVLEQFQREKESQIATETERYQQEAQQLKEKTRQLETQIAQAKAELDEAADGLAAASRLSEQLDRKEEVLQAIKEEVQQKEGALRAAEEEIHKLTSNTEAKVDRLLMKNLLLGYFHTPSRNRKDAIHAIGSVLGFTHDDFLRIEEGEGGGGWVSSLLRRARTESSPPSTPVRQIKTPDLNQSFSQLFVKFLETESTPPPAPFRLPAEEMAREAQQRHHARERDPHDKPAFNPFRAPRHVSMPIPVGPAAETASSAGPHILMAPPGSPTTTFPVFSPFSLAQDGHAEGIGTRANAGGGRSAPQTSSTILKDVLGSR